MKVEMKALILVGGYGTRMRPLTLHCPKPILPFCNKTMVQHQIQALAKVGVTEVVLGINCLSHHKAKSTQELHELKDPKAPINHEAQQIMHQLKDFAQKYHITITYSQRLEALGTAGPLKHAESELTNGNASGLFFVMNGDVIADYPLQQLLDFHKSHGKEGTIVLAQAEDPSRFGVVVTSEGGKVQRFVEKPKIFISNSVNAGFYIFNLSILKRIPNEFCMIERQIFPLMASEGELYSIKLKNKFWNDIGIPESYISTQGEYLDYYKMGQVLIDESSVIEEGASIGPNVVIGPNCKVGAGSKLSNCTLIADCVIGKNVYINNTIVSWSCSIGNWARIEGLSVIGEDVEVKEQVRITECKILPHVCVAHNVSHQILM